MMIHITFEIFLSSLNKYISEIELNEQLNQLQQELIALPYLNGKLIITDPAASLKIVIRDELEAIIQNLCFTGVEEFSKFKKAEIPLFSESGVLKMIEEDKDTLRFIQNENSYIFDQKMFLLQLFQCGCRFIDLLEKMPEAYRISANELKVYRDKCITIF